MDTEIRKSDVILWHDRRFRRCHPARVRESENARSRRYAAAAAASYKNGFPFVRDFRIIIVGIYIYIFVYGLDTAE